MADENGKLTIPAGDSLVSRLVRDYQRLAALEQDLLAEARDNSEKKNYARD